MAWRNHFKIYHCQKANAKVIVEATTYRKWSISLLCYISYILITLNKNETPKTMQQNLQVPEQTEKQSDKDHTEDVIDTMEFDYISKKVPDK